MNLKRSHIFIFTLLLYSNLDRLNVSRINFIDFGVFFNRKIQLQKD